MKDNKVTQEGVEVGLIECWGWETGNKDELGQRRVLSTHEKFSGTVVLGISMKRPAPAVADESEGTKRRRVDDVYPCGPYESINSVLKTLHFEKLSRNGGHRSSEPSSPEESKLDSQN